LSCELLERQN